ncbi:activator of HSP90 ATPase [Mesorhizobium sp. L-8-10]|uniref:SRPBCC family protein n=1 Tax=unclassified Mesorhizobium TaxID=325217 RepID=UPI0019296BE5|nr:MULTISPECIES: SRPBCC domain-containing protein [unclassified Mesorhizobium]BCH26486.1 activator of HSP90 ATPase [Mesorhizobium sp. L-8-3]BCH34470.1 activator of HSP90 ATPase [Mesorhizobium sp. L-8-10]
MNDQSNTRSIIIEREIAFPPQKIWRALTQPHLIGEWLMKNDFEPVVGHRFGLRAEWGSVECEVLEVEPHKTLSYTWGDHDLKSVVTWTLTDTDKGTRLRMEQSGFRQDQPRYYGGAKAGWPQLFDKLEEVLAQLD